MQLSEMRNYVRNVVDIDDTDISDPTLNAFIGEGYDLIVYSEKRWPFFEVANTFLTANGTKDYSLAAVGVNVKDAAERDLGLREINSLRTNKHVIEYIGSDDGDIMYPLDSTNTGEPLYWSYWGESVRFYPTPDAAYTISMRGYRNAEAFSADTDSPDLPDAFDRVLSLYAIYRSYQQQEDGGMSQQYYVSFVGELDNLAKRFNDTPAAQPMILNSRRSGRRGLSRMRYSWE
jgi:hypothetical protein